MRHGASPHSLPPNGQRSGLSPGSTAVAAGDFAMLTQCLLSVDCRLSRVIALLRRRSRSAGLRAPQTTIGVPNSCCSSTRHSTPQPPRYHCFWIIFAYRNFSGEIKRKVRLLTEEGLKLRADLGLADRSQLFFPNDPDVDTATATATATGAGSSDATAGSGRLLSRNALHAGRSVTHVRWCALYGRRLESR